jgi:hypothetical protein
MIHHRKPGPIDLALFVGSRGSNAAAEPQAASILGLPVGLAIGGIIDPTEIDQLLEGKLGGLLEDLTDR